MASVTERTPLQKIEDPFILSAGVNLYVKRLDMNHPYISGNKWYKLKYNIPEIEKTAHKTVLTFGGAYSNHIAAVAVAGEEFGFRTIGVIRGEEQRELNGTLSFAIRNGMKLHFVSREDYRKKESKEFISSLSQQFGDFYLLPEGGSNDLAVKGCGEILNDVKIPFNWVCSSCGTGATLAGLILSLKQGQQAIGFSSLKGANYLEEEVEKQLSHFQINSSSNWQINNDYHFGRYAKTPKELLDFIRQFEMENNIPLDNIYTGKMMFGIYDLVKKSFFKRGETIIALHTGGLSAMH